MLSPYDKYKSNKELIDKIKNIKIFLTDNDGVLTDTGVYYSAMGEELKKFSIRDGMGVERLRKFASIDTGIVSGEMSASLQKRADKLQITILNLGIKDKQSCIDELLLKMNLSWKQLAFMGDDYNDLEILKKCGFSACPSDALPFVKECVDYIADAPGGHGAFRDAAELIIMVKNDFEFKY